MALPAYLQGELEQVANMQREYAVWAEGVEALVRKATRETTGLALEDLPEVRAAEHRRCALPSRLEHSSSSSAAFRRGVSTRRAVRKIAFPFSRDDDAESESERTPLAEEDIRAPLTTARPIPATRH